MNVTNINRIQLPLVYRQTDVKKIKEDVKKNHPRPKEKGKGDRVDIFV